MPVDILEGMGGEDDGAGKAPGRHVGKSPLKRLEQPCAAIGRAGGRRRRTDDAHLEIGEALESKVTLKARRRRARARRVLTLLVAAPPLP